MGQVSSRVTDAAKKAATAVAAAPRISQSLQSQRNRAAAGDFESNKSPHSVASTGEYTPNRGRDHIIPTASASALEMPPDLIKFLNEAGPLKRSVDKELTSPKVYDALVKNEKASEEHTKQANTRIRRSMPIVSSKESDRQKEGDRSGVDIALKHEELNDGSTIVRSTNFSTLDRSEAFEGLGIQRKALFLISKKLEELQTHDTSEWKTKVKNEFQTMIKEKNSATLSPKDAELLENCFKYIGVPVIMKEGDEDIIGTWAHKVKDYEHSGLKVTQEETYQFVMINEDVLNK